MQKMTLFHNKIEAERESFRTSYQSKKPFKYLIIDDVLKEKIAQQGTPSVPLPVPTL